MPETAFHAGRLPCRVAVLWIDWYAYHVGRFLGLDAAPSLRGRVAGIEMVGGVGVHAGLKFREDLPAGLAVDTLLPQSDWRSADKWQLARLVWRRLSELDPQVVLVPGYYTLPAVAAAVWARVHRRASVLMTESTAYDHPRVAWKEALKGAALRLLFGWAVCGGKDHVAYLRQLGFRDDRTVGFYDVVDNGFFRDGVAALRAAGTSADSDLPAAPYFLYVGRFAPEKNVLGLLRSWLQYRRQGGTWPLVLVGDGPEMPAICAVITDANVADAVLLPGLKASAELLPFYAHAGCFVLPSTREPWGLVVNEAMAAGLPVIVSNRCGCAADLVAGEPGGVSNGIVFDPAMSDAASGSANISMSIDLTAALRHIASLSEAERARMGRASSERIAGYTPERFGLAVASIADFPGAHTGLAAASTGGAQ